MISEPPTSEFAAQRLFSPLLKIILLPRSYVDNKICAILCRIFAEAIKIEAIKSSQLLDFLDKKHEKIIMKSMSISTLQSSSYFRVLGET